MNRMRAVALAIATLCFLPPLHANADTASDILDATGVRGGLIVHLGCGDGELTAALGKGDAYLVQGLDADPADVAASRQTIQAAGLYGTVAADQLTGEALPFIDNLINLVVVDELGKIDMAEVMRVLCPGGVAYVRQGDQWKKTVKPWPEDIDEWTHFLHGPDNNAVAHDTVVDIPRRLQWLGLPKFARAHEQLASLSACVTTAGRLFYIIDDTPRADIRFPSQWFLVARDAFNGVVLWKQPIPTWMDQFRRFLAGPAGTMFRLAAKDDRVYVTLGVDAPVSILDAGSGETVAICEGTEHARQILRIDDRLLTLIDTAPQTSKEEDSLVRRGEKPSPGKRAIAAVDATNGELLWRKEIDAFVHPTVAASGDQFYYQTSEELVCAALDSGTEVWRVAVDFQLTGHEAGWESPTLMVHDQNVYCADFKRLIAFSAADGAELWSCRTSAGYNSPPDVFAIDDLVWINGKEVNGLDPTNGEVKQTLSTVRGYMHPRCYRNKATDRFFLLGNQGVQFVDLEGVDAALHHWIRGTCQYGIMPANGLLYVTPDSCACNMKSKLPGLWVLAGEAKNKQQEASGPVRVQQGPAFGAVDLQISNSDAEAPGDWPVFRHDPSRSGITQADVPTDLRQTWRAEIGGKLSGVTSAGGKVFVAAVDRHTVMALDQQSGDTVWSFTAGGRIDSPPTIYRGMAVFGSADGWVYALRATDGQLVWRSLAAPDDRRTFVNGQLESVWPVHGSILVHQGELVVTAGRSSYLDDGIRLCRINPQDGQLVAETVMYSPDPETGKQPLDGDRKDVQGALSDILLSDGEDVYMRHVKLDFETGDHTATGVHLFCPIGLLDDTWWHRAYWVVSDQFTSHWSGWWKVGNVVPSGRILSYDKQTVFGYGRDKYPSGNTGQWRGGEVYQLFACTRPDVNGDQQDVVNQPAARTPAEKAKGRKAKPEPTPTVANLWTNRPPFYVRAMVVAGQQMFAAGPPELTTVRGEGEEALQLADPQEALGAWTGKRGGQLWVLSTETGEKLAEYPIESPPIFDGMAATDGRLYMATTDGNVICLGK